MPRAKKLDPKKYRDNPIAIAHYLTDAFDKNDLSVVLGAIQSIVRARRDNLYRTFRGNADPLFSRILNLLAGFDVRFTVQPLPPSEKPPRPKLGRPPSARKVEANLSGKQLVSVH